MLNYLSVLNPFPQKEKIVYGKVIELKKSEDKEGVIVEITLINDEMIKFDKSIYGNEGLLDTIIKYFIKPVESYKNRIKNISKEYMLEDELNWIFQITKSSDFLNENKFRKELTKNFDGFTPYFYEFSALVNNEDTIKILSKYFNNGQYYKFNIVTSGDNSNTFKTGEKFILGETLFSASPIVIKKSQLTIVDSIIDSQYRIEKILNYSDFETNSNILDDGNPIEIQEFSNILNKCLPSSINNIKYTMYHVGQGLCSYISFNRNYGMFFDIGFSKDANRDKSIQFNTNGSFNRYKGRIPKAIVLSHWDLDHILGVVYCNKEIYNRIWIAPNINEIANKKLSNSALRLSKYISLRERLVNSLIKSPRKYKKILFLINKNYNNKQIFKSFDGKFILHKGKGTGTKNHSNKENNIGLILELINSKKLLLTGDVDYIKMPTTILNSTFNFLQVPHHGADVGRPKFKPAKCTKPIAIVPVSDVNRYGHPKYKEHLNILKKYGFYIHRTDRDGEITVNF